MTSTKIKKNAMIPFHDLGPEELVRMLEVVKHKTMLNEDEAALFLNITINAIRALRYKRKLSHYKFGGRIQYKMNDLQNYANDHLVPSFNRHMATVVA